MMRFLFWIASPDLTYSEEHEMPDCGGCFPRVHLKSASSGSWFECKRAFEIALPVCLDDQ
jgi:hypothetical protein